MLTLQLIITLAFFEIETLAYLVINRISARLPSVDLLTPEDRAVPFRARSLWLYLSFVPYCLLMVFEFGSIRRMCRVFVCVLVNSLVAYRSFLRSPSSYPRPSVTPDRESRLGRSWSALHAVDRPSNTFPSLHVSHAFLLALMMSGHVPKERTEAHLLWATVIALSTLLTKQHYIVDVSAGILVAEAIAAELYEPWEAGRLDVRHAIRRLRLLCQTLDTMAASPGDCRLPCGERHPRVADLVRAYAGEGSMARLYASAPGRTVLFERKLELLRFLGSLRGVLSVANAMMPGWLQFIRDLEETNAQVTDDAVHAFLREFDRDLHGLFVLILQGPDAAQASKLQAMRPSIGSKK